MRAPHRAASAIPRAVQTCFEVNASPPRRNKAQCHQRRRVAVLAANARLRSAALNVFVNAKAIKDRDFAEKQLAEVNALITRAAETTESIFQTVRAKIGS